MAIRGAGSSFSTTFYMRRGLTPRVVVAPHVAEAGDLPPGDAGVTRLALLTEALGRLANDLEIAHHGVPGHRPAVNASQPALV